MIKTHQILLTLAASVALSACTTTPVADFNTVPQPQTVELSSEAPYSLKGDSYISYDKNVAGLQDEATFLQQYIKDICGLSLEVSEAEKAESRAIHLSVNSSIENPDAFQITVTADCINIEGGSESGVFYGVQTLRKSIPVKLAAKSRGAEIPAGVVADEPRFGYRGMHLDVSRHFFDANTVKKYIDLLAMHGINRFHWHLTDDQGWRVEIEKYPRLTEVGSTRNSTVVGYPGSGQYDNTEHGGFYTKAEIKEIVEYAAKQHITIIPEIDLPGHMLAALAGYPEYGCTGGPYDVWPEWGVSENVLCLGNEQTYTFMEDILAEISELFPSKFIHIGGDEVPYVRWEECPKCQAAIKAAGLKDDSNSSAESKLHNHCMARIAAFLAQKGKQVICWDEVIDGGVLPSATIMAWRGTDAAVKAAKMGHDVIMTPTSHCYFDYYQSTDTENEPFAFNSYLPIEQVYTLDAPQGLTEEEAKRIIGCQANVWTEYILDEPHLFYMALPRMAAMAEIQWGAPESRDIKDLTNRLSNMFDLYDLYGYNYAQRIYDIKATYTPDFEQKGILVTFTTNDDAQIEYQIDGKSAVYEEPFLITHSCTLTATATRSNGRKSQFSKTFDFNKATMAAITVDTTYLDPRYTYGGAPTLVDGLEGGEVYRSGEWLGFIGGDAIVDITLNELQPVSEVNVNSLVNISSWIMNLKGLEVATSEDGVTYTPVKVTELNIDPFTESRGIARHAVKFEECQAKYVKVTLQPYSELPEWHLGAGYRPYIFIDEIAVK